MQPAIPSSTVFRRVLAGSGRHIGGRYRQPNWWWRYGSGHPSAVNNHPPWRWRCAALSARDTRYQSAVCVQEQSRFYLPRFTWIRGGRREATAGRPFVYGDESKVEGSRRSAACYLVSFTIITTYILPSDGSVLWWKVLFRSEQSSASIAIRSGLLC